MLPKFNALEDKLIADMYLSGDSSVLIATKFDVSPKTITSSLRRSGVVIRSPKIYSSDGERAKAWGAKNRPRQQETNLKNRLRRLASGCCKSCRNVRMLNSANYCRYHWFVEMTGTAIGSYRKENAARLIALFEQQEGKCAYTGVELVPGVNASLDHIFPVSRFRHIAKHIDNLEWVCLSVNYMKRDRTRDEFLEACRLITSRAATPLGLLDREFTPMESAAIKSLVEVGIKSDHFDRF